MCNYTIFLYSSRSTITNLPPKDTEDKSEDGENSQMSEDMEVEFLDDNLNYTAEYKETQEIEQHEIETEEELNLSIIYSNQESDIEDSLSAYRNEGYQSEENLFDEGSENELPIRIPKNVSVSKKNITPRPDNETPKIIRKKVSVTKKIITPRSDNETPKIISQNANQPNSTKKNKSKSLDMDKEFSETLGTFNTYLKTKTSDRNTSQGSLESTFANIGFAKLVDTLMQKIIDPKQLHQTEKKILDVIYDQIL